MPDIDPVCLVHGKRKSEHECLYCCLCFKSLTREECSYLPDGSQVDICIPCAQEEQKVLVEFARRANKWMKGIPEDLDNGEGRELVNTIYPLVNAADKVHIQEGGSTRHWVRDYSLPLLRSSGFTIIETERGTTGD